MTNYAVPLLDNSDGTGLNMKQKGTAGAAHVVPYAQSAGQDIFSAGEKLGSASNLNSFQLWNPAASGVNGVLTMVIARPTTAGAIRMYKNTAALTTDKSATSSNLNLGGSAPLLEFRSDDQTAGNYTGAVQIAVGGASANRSVELLTLVGTTITPGKGIIVENSENTGAFVVSYQWTESAV